MERATDGVADTLRNDSLGIGNECVCLAGCYLALVSCARIELPILVASLFVNTSLGCSLGGRDSGGLNRAVWHDSGGLNSWPPCHVSPSQTRDPYRPDRDVGRSPHGGA